MQVDTNLAKREYQARTYVHTYKVEEAYALPIAEFVQTFSNHRTSASL